MILPLEKLLKQYCEKDELDFTKRLRQIRELAQQFWKVPKLPWYTDHGYDHSQRVIDVLGQIVEHLQDTDEKLNSSELFIVLAACYLHDIGMQDLNVDGREVETLGPDDYETIRRRHPGRAYQLITSKSDRFFGIDPRYPPTWIKAIALVSQGHGSEFFEETLNQFARSRHKILHWTIRGELLTALLMMADELDLCDERAQLQSEMKLSSFSTMHHHIHLYVSSVEVVKGVTDKERRICIWFEYPDDSSTYVKTRKWLIGKLHRQCQITAPIIKSATNGELEWCKHIGYHEVVEYGGRVCPTLPERALFELDRELVQREIVGYAPERDILKSTVLESSKYCTLCLVSKDEMAKRQIAKWLRANCASQGIWYWDINLQTSATNPKDVPIRLRERMRAQSPVSARSDRQQERDAKFVESKPLNELRDMIGKDLHWLASRQRIVLVFQNVDSATTKTAHWLEQDFIPKLAERNVPLQVILTYNEAPKVKETLGEPGVLVPLGNFSKNDIVTQYRQEFGFSEAEAEEKAQFMFKITEGDPWRVIAWFGSEREKRAENLGEGKEV